MTPPQQSIETTDDVARSDWALCCVGPSAALVLGKTLPHTAPKEAARSTGSKGDDGTRRALSATMTNNTGNSHLTRDTILKLLSNEELARVVTVASGASLAEGDEYLEIEQPNRGIRRSVGSSTLPAGRLLLRKAVLATTWQRILTLLAGRESNGASRLN